MRPLVVSLCLCAFLFTAALAIEKEPSQEYHNRRIRLAERIKGNVAVLHAAPDQELVKYQQERNFYYLTGFDEPNATLLLDASTNPPQEYLFLPERKTAEERWTGVKLGPGAEAERVTGFAKVLPEAEFDGILKKVSEHAKSVYKLKDIENDIAYLRQVKSPTELSLLEKAIDITDKAQEAAARTIGPGVMEYEVEAALEYEFRRNGAERPGFPSIVGSGPFSTILHYDKSERRMQNGDVVVVDIGAEYGGYSGDVTRTYPVSGKFSASQREIYQIVLDAQKAAMAKVKPGRGSATCIRPPWLTFAQRVTRNTLFTEPATISGSTFTMSVTRRVPSSPTWWLPSSLVFTFRKNKSASASKMMCL